MVTRGWARKWHPTPVLLSGKSHGRRSLVGCSPWGCEESDMTEWLHFHFLLSHIGEGNGNPLQCSWRIPGTGEPGGLPSMGSHRVGHDWSDLAAAHICKHIHVRAVWETFCKDFHVSKPWAKLHNWQVVTVMVDKREIIFKILLKMCL